jgi:pimeloyl-ACP methyl ester carboxylesterase
MNQKTEKKILPFTVGRFHKSKCIEGFADLGDARIHYYITGQGHPVVLLHGNGEDYTVFKDLIPLLKNRYRVIALDTRGHGLSPAGDAPWNFELFARDAAEVLAALDVGKAAVIGFSDGGNTALHMARSYSAQLAGVAAAGANAWPGGLKGTARLGIIARYAAYTLGAHFSKKSVAGKRLYALMVKEPRLKPEDLEDIALPVLLISGDADVVSSRHTRILARKIPQAQLIYEAGADHFAFVREPGRYIQRLEAFLDALDYT